jgi:hypothetical protein
VPGQEDLAGPGEVFVAGPGVLSTGMDNALARVAREFHRDAEPAVRQRGGIVLYPRTDAAPYFDGASLTSSSLPACTRTTTGRPTMCRRSIRRRWKRWRGRSHFVSTLAGDPVRPRMDKPLPPNLVALLAQ